MAVASGSISRDIGPYPALTKLSGKAFTKRWNKPEATAAPRCLQVHSATGKPTKPLNIAHAARVKLFRDAHRVCLVCLWRCCCSVQGLESNISQMRRLLSVLEVVFLTRFPEEWASFPPVWTLNLSHTRKLLCQAFLGFLHPLFQEADVRGCGRVLEPPREAERCSFLLRFHGRLVQEEVGIDVVDLLKCIHDEIFEWDIVIANANNKLFHMINIYNGSIGQCHHHLHREAVLLQV